MDKSTAKLANSFVNMLTEKAARAEDADDAMKFSSAAVNVANAFCALRVVNRA